MFIMTILTIKDGLGGASILQLQGACSLINDLVVRCPQQYYLPLRVSRITRSVISDALVSRDVIDSRGKTRTRLNKVGLSAIQVHPRMHACYQRLLTWKN